MKRLIGLVLTLALTLCAGAPAVAFAAETAQPADTQTEEVQVASTGGNTTQNTTTATRAATPQTGDPLTLAVPAALAGAALVAGGVALSRTRKE